MIFSLPLLAAVLSAVSQVRADDEIASSILIYPGKHYHPSTYTTCTRSPKLKLTLEVDILCGGDGTVASHDFKVGGVENDDWFYPIEGAQTKAFQASGVFGDLHCLYMTFIKDGCKYRKVTFGAGRFICLALVS